MEIEGRVMELLERGVDAVEALAAANEKIVEQALQPDFIVEEGPPVCPHCGALNPEITQLGTDGSGPLAEFVLVGETHCCNKTIYCAPTGMVVYQTVNELKGGNVNGAH